MFEEELLRAKLRRQRIMTLFIVGAFLTSAAIGILFVLDLRIGSKGASIERQSFKKNEKAVTDELADSDEFFQPSSQIPARSSINLEKKSQLDFRDKYFEALDHFEQNIRPKFERIKSLGSNTAASDELNNMEIEASDFAVRSQYRDAFHSIMRASAFAEDKSLGEITKLQSFLKQISEAWKAGDFSLVSKLASNASLIDPQNSELQRISKLIKDRGAVEKYLSLAESYKAQGDLDMAIISLENISDLTHDIEDLETRISTLEVERNEIIQNELIENLFAKLEIPDLLEAGKTITKMRDVGVPEEKYSHLLEDYNQKKYDYQLAEALHAIDLAMSEDKWREAKQIVDSSQNKFSTDAVFNAKSTTVTRIHSGLLSIESIFLQPEKRTNPRAQAYAASLIERLNSDFELSPTLEQ